VFALRGQEEEGPAMTIQRVEYFYTTVRDQPGEAFKILSAFAADGVNLLAFLAMPLGPESAQFTLFPEDAGALVRAAQRSGQALDGPHSAILVQGEDRLGALAEVHSKLVDEEINVYAATCVTDGAGKFGYLMYVRPSDIDRAVAALKA
jgi:hypothetical protein